MDVLAHWHPVLPSRLLKRRPVGVRLAGVPHHRAMGENGAMAWAWAYLGVSAAGALLVLNAFRPMRHQFLIVPSFFAGIYTAEMPVWHVVWQVAATAAFAAVGAFGSWPGWVGLGVNLAAWGGLVAHFKVSGRAHHVFTRAEAEVALSPVEVDGLPLHGGETMWRFPRLVYPLPRPVRSFDVVRHVDYVGDRQRAHRLDVIRRRHDPPARAPVLVYIHGGRGSSVTSANRACPSSTSRPGGGGSRSPSTTA